MSLTTIGLAFVLVAILFNAAGVITGGWGFGVGDSGKDRAPATVSWGARARAAWPGATAEALVLTLLAALWFGSLGQGGWVLLFLLLGALAGVGRWLGPPPPGRRRGGEIGLFVASLLKYLLAGLVCLWRLS